MHYADTHGLHDTVDKFMHTRLVHMERQWGDRHVFDPQAADKAFREGKTETSPDFDLGPGESSTKQKQQQPAAGSVSSSRQQAVYRPAAARR